MKINKSKLQEAVENEESINDINPQIDSVTEIASALQNTVEDASNEKVTLNTQTADELARDIKEVGKEVKASYVSLQSKDRALNLDNEITRALNSALKAATRIKTRQEKGWRTKSAAYQNVLIIGEPGSGKTSIVQDWAAANGINIFGINTTDARLNDALYGYTLRDLNSENKNKLTKTFSDFLDQIDRPNTVLFLDEYNRGSSDVRTLLLPIINEHKLTTGAGETGDRIFNNLLFVVACMNPGKNIYDRGAQSLSTHEFTRFSSVVQFNSTPERTLQYLTADGNAAIKEMAKEKDSLTDKDEIDFYYDELEHELRVLDLGAHILTSKDFSYNTYADNEEISDLQASALNSRSFVQLLDRTDGKLDLMRTALENGKYKDTNFTKDKTDMLIKILNSYVNPTLDELIDDKEAELKISLRPGKELLDKASAEPAKSTQENEEEFIEDDVDFGYSGNINKKGAPDSETEYKADLENTFSNWQF